jgi:FG-GAP-like repeat/Tetratricopeptide repeat/ASPIC and UnbV
MSFTDLPARSRRPWLVALVLIVLAAGYVLYRQYTKVREPDMAAALAANNKGIGLMEQFQYQPAADAFETVVALAPNWTPGRINLGIALLNTAKDPKDANLARARKLFDQVLSQEPDNPYAHYGLGMIAQYQNHLEEAAPRFEKVTQLDPNDAHAWYFLAESHPQGKDSAAARECLRRALQLNPYLNTARYALAIHPDNQGKAEASSLLAEFKELKEAKWEALCEIKYSEMGKYAEVIGRADDRVKPKIGPLPLFALSKDFHVTLAPGARWATGADFGAGPVGDLRRAVRARFGATLVLLDYNRDGRPDLFLLGAVVEKGAVRDLLLRNDGNSLFSDVTAEAGLAGPWPSLGCCVADVDNDGWPDLLITGAGVQKLFRNDGKGHFEDRGADAGLDKLTSVCLGCAAVDLDQDGDLDLVLAQYADTVDEALKRLRGEKAADGPGLAVFLNVGKALPVPPGKLSAGLTLRFTRAKEPKALLGHGPVVGLALSDLDGDRDVDLLMLPDRAAPAALLNDRLLRFHQAEGNLAAAHPWNGALVFDLAHDERSALLLLPANDKPLLLRNNGPVVPEDVGRWFSAAPVASPPLKQAHAVDLDLDGWTDIVGLSAESKPVLLHNDGTGRLVQRRGALGAEDGWPTDLVAVAVADLFDNCAPDLLLWSEADGLQLRTNQGNGNRALRLELLGIHNPDPYTRSNSDAIGARVIAQVGTLYTSVENTTLSAGLGQSRLPLALGLGPNHQADVVRVAWPDGVPQAELNVPSCDRYQLKEANRKITSCPVLLTWDGQRFIYVTDFLGAGSVGELGPDGSTRPPRPEESVKIEAGQLAPRDGHYVLKITEPLDEILYLDRLQLTVLDHPPNVSVYPDERFATSDPPPTQDLLAFREQIFPVSARDHHGRDVTALLRERDKKFVEGFARRSWLGFAEEHWVELDFGTRLDRFAGRIRAGASCDRLFLCLAGWTDYPYPESIYAASQAGVAMQPPVLEQQDAEGKWHKLDEIGFPAGLPRLMTKEVTRNVGQTFLSAKLRIRTNLQVFWDQVYLAPLLENVTLGGAQPNQVRTATLEVADATLAARRFLQEIRTGKLIEYDDARTESVAVSRWVGQFTRLGDVTDLLRRADDCFAICAPGDEITVRFDARNLPPLPPGWTRSFVLRTWGYCKDASLFTAASAAVEPLPFRAMRNYPPGPDEKYPTDPLHEEYRRRYNTRRIGPDQPTGASRARQ